MHVHLDNRQDAHDCTAGKRYYQCAVNSFTGCCGVDPCSLSGCRDNSTVATPDSAISPDSLPSRPTWVTDSDSEPTASPRRESGTISAPEAQTIASVNGGQTVYITITHDYVSTTAPQQPDTTLASSNKTISHKARDGAIAGGIIGGMVVIYAAFFMLSFIQRRKTAKKRKQATLPPPYGDTDMSGQLNGSATTAASLVIEAVRASGANEKAGTTDGGREPVGDSDLDAVAQLDSRMIRPTMEVDATPLGNIPELPANADNSFNMSDSSTDTELTNNHQKRSGNRSGNLTDHVMSWAQFNSLGNRQPASRLEQPHSAPESSAAVWENMGSPQTGTFKNTHDMGREPRKEIEEGVQLATISE